MLNYWSYLLSLLRICVLQAKYETTLQEKNKLLQVIKDLQIKIKTLHEKQADILQHSSVKKNLFNFRSQ